MTSSSHYKSNLRDIFFNLFEVFEIQRQTLGQAPYENLDEETVRDSLKMFETLCVEEIASSFAEGDEVPLKLDDNGNVHLPEGVKKSMAAFFDGGWYSFDLPEELGGFNAPRSVYWSGFEMLVGANPPIALYLFSSFLIRILNEIGTESQKKRYIKNMVDHRWGATMVLTESEAGSDVGAGRAKARHVKDDEWEVEGVKRFITNGDFDSTSNIVHCVLARPEGADVGTKGLSLFLIPKYWVDEDGKIGERNGVYCSNLEKKMGIKGSATCEITFGDKKPARALLVGNVHDGIRQMFKVIEQARMAVGVKSMSTLSTAYLNALEFCKERVQGPDLLKAMDKHSPRVRIIEHPDVRRMLMLQKSHAEGMRALCTYCTVMQDEAIIVAARGDAAKAKEHHQVSDILLPLIKGYNSERAYDLLSVSLQCFGGSGYLKDYPIEQYIRDQKIDSLYEGTTHMQALDLIFRKIAKNGAMTLQIIFDEIRRTLEKRTQVQALAHEYDELAKAMSDAEGILVAMMGKISESFYHVGLQGNRILCGIAELVIGWLLVKQAEVAVTKREAASAADKAFYEGKIASARFFCHQALPNLALARTVIENNTLDLLEVPEQAF